MLNRAESSNTQGRRSRAVGRVLLCACSILIAVVLFEVPALLGLVDYRSLFQTRSAPWERPGNHPDAALLYKREGNRRLRPILTGNDLARLRGGPSPTLYHCDVRYDRDGFRNPRDFDAADIVVLGDSLVEGFHVDASEIVTARLAQRLGLAVVNLARGGDGPRQELEIFKQYGLRLRPKVCVWTFYEGNDLADSAEYETNQRRVEIWSRRPLWRRGVKSSFTANCLGYLDRTFVHPEARVSARLFTGRFAIGPGDAVDLAFGSGDYRVESPREASPEFEQVKKTIAEARTLCQERGIAFVFVYIPSKFRVYRDLCTFVPDSPCRSWVLDDLPDAMRKAVGRLSAELVFVDLTPRMQEEAETGSLVYLPDDTHWSSAGHSIAAEELARVCDQAGDGRVRRR